MLIFGEKWPQKIINLAGHYFSEAAIDRGKLVIF